MCLEKKLRHIEELKTEVEFDLLFEEIYNKYYRYVCFIVSTNVNNRLDSEEIVNDVFTNFYLNMHKLQLCFSLPAYLKKSAKNAVIDYYRRRHPENISLDSFEGEIVEDHQCKDDKVLDEFYELVSGFISKEDITLLYEHLFMNLTFNYIAKRDNYSVNTVKSRYLRALNKIREKIGYEHKKK